MSVSAMKIIKVLMHKSGVKNTFLCTLSNININWLEIYNTDDRYNLSTDMSVISDYLGIALLMVNALLN